MGTFRRGDARDHSLKSRHRPSCWYGAHEVVEGQSKTSKLRLHVREGHDPPNGYSLSTVALLAPGFAPQAARADWSEWSERGEQRARSVCGDGEAIDHAA